MDDDVVEDSEQFCRKQQNCDWTYTKIMTSAHIDFDLWQTAAATIGSSRKRNKRVEPFDRSLLHGNTKPNECDEFISRHNSEKSAKEGKCFVDKRKSVWLLWRFEPNSIRIPMTENETKLLNNFAWTMKKCDGKWSKIEKRNVCVFFLWLEMRDEDEKERKLREKVDGILRWLGKFIDLLPSFFACVSRKTN